MEIHAALHGNTPTKGYNMKTTIRLTGTLLAAILAGAALSACDRKDDTRTAGEKVDAVVADAKDKAVAAQAEAKKDLNDVTITASVNAELAKDPTLSALSINVDTTNGNVLLRGSAPDSAARQRATDLAAAVPGVSSVDNQLAVKP